LQALATQMGDWTQVLTHVIEGQSMALCHSIVAKIHNSKLPKFLGSNEGMQVY
jgi:hypothetical protein